VGKRGKKNCPAALATLFTQSKNYFFSWSKYLKEQKKVPGTAGGTVDPM
jgi:hypothetical protein